MNGREKRKLLALGLCLLLCMSMVGFAQAALEAASGEAVSGAADVQTSASVNGPARMLNEETPEKDARKINKQNENPDAPPPEISTASAPMTPAEDSQGAREAIEAAPAPVDAPEGKAPEAPVETSDPVAHAAQTESPAPTEAPESAEPSEGGDGGAEQQGGDEAGETGDDAAALPEGEALELPEAGEAELPMDAPVEEALPGDDLEQAVDADEIVPVITLTGSIEGDYLAQGVPVTIRAQISGIPDGVGYDLQWQNDRDGAFQDAPDETGLHVTFRATRENVQWAWRLVVTLHGADETA